MHEITNWTGRSTFSIQTSGFVKERVLSIGEALMPLSCDTEGSPNSQKDYKRLCDVILLNKQKYFMDIQGQNHSIIPLGHSHQIVFIFAWLSSLFTLASDLGLCSCVFSEHVGYGLALWCCLDNILLSNPRLSEPHIWHGQFTSFMRHWPHTPNPLCTSAMLFGCGVNAQEYCASTFMMSIN